MSISSSAASPIVVVGGCGFIGSNLAASLMASGEHVVVLDNLSRPGVERNLAWLEAEYPGLLHLCVADIRNLREIEPVFRDARAVFHFAAQTAVTTSLDDPLADFETNAHGTLNVLEATRKAGRRAPVIFASTNKVYGSLDDIALEEHDFGYGPADAALRANGIGEDRRLEFCTPYGCSKGVADQYVLDYARSFGLPTAVLRMSCIYGPRQFGTEDQGWVAHFALKALRGEPVTIYGDGKQVRDILHVSDAVAAYRTVLDHIDSLDNRVFNLGGGPANAVSLNAVLAEIGGILGRPVAVSHGDWREGDQLFFVADTSRLNAALGWSAGMGWRDGLRDLIAWLSQDQSRPAFRQPQRVRA